MDSVDGGCLGKPVSIMDVSSQEDTEPCTQPMSEDDMEGAESQENNIDLEEDASVYAYLVPLQPAGSPFLKLSSDVFTVGRSVKNSLTISDRKTKFFDAVSKVHFILRRDSSTGIVTLQDKSSNGAFVNGRKVGKEKSVVLAHNDSVGMSGPRVRHFVYMSTSREVAKMHPAELRQRYLVSRELGKGACGTVYLGIRRDDYKQVAIKVIDRSRVSMLPSGASNNVMNEVRLLQDIDHPCVIKLEDVIETRNTLYIILELALGGELFDKIIEKTKLQEDEAKLHFYQIVSAIRYLHSKKIAHRDLKPENILLCSDDDHNPVVKVTDLGLSKFVDVHTHLKTFCGTPQYLAPEVLFSRVRGDGSYDLKVDMWSLGVILYILLCGCPPFNPDRSDKPLIRQVTEGDFTFPFKLWSKISLSAVDLVKKLMTVDASKRLSASETLQHEWLQDKAIVEKAEALMSGQPKQEDQTTFKRPLDEKNSPSCKRIRVRE